LYSPPYGPPSLFFVPSPYVAFRIFCFLRSTPFFSSSSNPSFSSFFSLPPLPSFFFVFDGDDFFLVFLPCTFGFFSYTLLKGCAARSCSSSLPPPTLFVRRFFFYVDLRPPRCLRPVHPLPRLPSVVFPLHPTPCIYRHLCVVCFFYLLSDSLFHSLAVASPGRDTARFVASFCRERPLPPHRIFSPSLLSVWENLFFDPSAVVFVADAVPGINFLCQSLQEPTRPARIVGYPFEGSHP